MSKEQTTLQYNFPDIHGRFGKFGGTYAPETLMPAIEALEADFEKAILEPEFNREFDYYMKQYVGRPSPLYYAANLTKKYGGAKIWLKREDLNHTGAHKINNSIGQAMLARRSGKTRIIAETGAGQHGVATATACALFGLQCVVYMGSEDVARQSPNVFRMKLLGAEVVSVESGSKTLKDAINEAVRDWITNIDNTFYIFGTAAGMHPYPKIVRHFQSIIGREARAQALEQMGQLPDAVVACIGGGSNAIGIFHEFINDESVKLIGVEAAGEGVDTLYHAATLTKGTPGVLHGSLSYVLQDEDGQVIETHSISAGLDYPGVGPEHAHLKETLRAEYVSATDDEALQAFQTMCRYEGIIPALESSHAIAYLEKLAPAMRPDQNIIVNLSGRGDKDINTIAKKLNISI